MSYYQSDSDSSQVAEARALAERRAKEMVVLLKKNEELTAEIQSLRDHLDAKVLVYYDRAKARKAKA